MIKAIVIKVKRGSTHAYGTWMLSINQLIIIKYLLNTHSAGSMKFREYTAKTWSLPFGNLWAKAI